MSDDQSSDGHKSWLEKLTQAFVREPKNRQELLELLRQAHSNEVLDIEALSIIEGALQVSDMQVRDIMVPRSQALPTTLFYDAQGQQIGSHLGELSSASLAHALAPLLSED